MKTLKTSLILALSILTLSCYATKEQFFSKSNSFFKLHVKNGLIDYKKIKSNPGELNALIELMGSTDITKEDKNTQLAFYINAYNLSVVQNVIKNYPLKSPLDIKGFFKTTTFKISGKNMTLDYLENQLIRPDFKDPRIHFALVCGAKGCPPIINEAYLPSNVQSILTRQTKSALDNSSYTKVSGSKVELTEIFNWYKQDFGNNDSEVIAFINKYKSKKLASSTTIGYYTYNWELNEIK